MARYTGPKVRVSRRLGTNIWGTQGREQGARAAALPAGRARPHPPPRQRLSEYLLQLQEKQKARFTYGLIERQFRNTLRRGHPPPGRHRREHAALLELRLDNVVYRAGWAATRPQARQFVSHGHINVNGSGSTSPATACARATSCALRAEGRGA